MKKKGILLSMLLVTFLVITPCGAKGVAKGAEQTETKEQQNTRVSVHDPSIIRAGFQFFRSA